MRVKSFTNGQVDLSFFQTVKDVTALLNSIPSAGSIVIDFGSNGNSIFFPGSFEIWR